MKVAITGHTGTIGQTICKVFTSRGDEIYGLSRKTGYDLSNAEGVAKAVATIINCDIFVNCAHVGYQQCQLTQQVAQHWKNSPGKRIIVFSSTAVNSLRPDHPHYTAQKVAVEKVAKNVHNQQEWPRMTILRFGTVEVPERPDLKPPKLVPADLGYAMNFILGQSPTCAVFEMTLAHPQLRFNLL